MAVGIHGSIETVLTAGLGGVPVWFGLRPTQQQNYPCVSFFDSGGTRNTETVFSSDPEDAERKWKLKTYPLRFEVYAVGLAACELLGELVEQVLEAKATVAGIASLSALTPDGVEIADAGGENYRYEKEWPEGARTYKGELFYSVRIKREC